MSSPFPLQVLFTAWGFRRSAQAWNGAQFLAERAKQVKAKTVAVQLGTDDQTGMPWTTTEEADVLRRNGLRVLVWGVADAPFVVRELSRLRAGTPDWMPQIESNDQRDKVYEAAAKGIKAQQIVTNYGGASEKADIEKLRSIGVKLVLVECYGGEVPVQSRLDTMLWQGTMYGWHEDEMYCLVGTYREELPSTYTHPEKLAKGYGFYLSEPMSVEQWDAWGKFVPPAPEVPVIPDPGVVRVGASKVLHTWLDPYQAQGRPQHASIIRIADRLLKLTPAQQRELNEALLIAELDRVGSPRT